jgi:hypothetical protein
MSKSIIIRRRGDGRAVLERAEFDPFPCNVVMVVNVEAITRAILSAFSIDASVVSGSPTAGGALGVSDILNGQGRGQEQSRDDFLHKESVTS